MDTPNTPFSFMELSLFIGSDGKPLPLIEQLAAASMLEETSHARGEAFFDPARRRTWPLEMREKMKEAGWYSVAGVHSSPGNVSYDIQTPAGIVEAVGYSWFNKIRWPIYY